MQWNFIKKIKIFDKVDKYVTTCDFTKSKMMQGGIDKEKIICIPTFIDSSKITPCYENDRYFLFLGRMAHQKGVIYAIEAMKYLKDSDYVLKITGQLSDSEEDKYIRSYIDNNGLEDKIVFTGFKHGEELKELIARSTCIVCPAIWYENMPNTVIESYAYGKPVVASKIGSLAEIVVDNETGLLFEPKNSKELSVKLNMFITDDKLSFKLGQQARKKCEIDYSEDSHMNKLISVLKNEDDI